MPGSVCRPKDLPLIAELLLRHLGEMFPCAIEGLPFLITSDRRRSPQRATPIVPTLQTVQE
jgi:hypothetical protein